MLVVLNPKICRLVEGNGRNASLESKFDCQDSEEEIGQRWKVRARLPSPDEAELPDF
jgi:hypothetical protein